MKTYATRYEILRQVSPTSLRPCPVQPSEKPLRVAFLLDEAEFVKSGGLMTHHETVFFEDRNHDWDWRDAFYYYGHAMGIEDVGDIVAVFEEEKR